MANLTSFILQNLAKPTGIWPKLFDLFESFIGNYGWTIVLFTLAVKLIVSPFDFYNRYSTRKNTLIQKRLSNQVQKINQKYSHNRDECNRQVASLYKKEGYNMIGSCVFMLINLIVTLVVFFTFFNSLRTISTYKLLNQYDTLQDCYYKTLNETGSVEAAEAETLELYLDVNDKNQWLWVNNIWRKDAKVNSIPTYQNMVEATKSSNKKVYIEYINNIPEEQYNAVTKSIKSENKDWNGYFILAILVLCTTFLSQYLSEKNNDPTKKAKENNELNTQTQNTMKIMKLVMPLIMLIFVITNTASFGIYILIGNIFGILTNLLFGIIVKKLTKTEEEKYFAYLEKESIKNAKKPVQSKPKMVTYKNLGDRL